jgi:putative peptidoglycan lipid II flippase
MVVLAEPILVSLFYYGEFSILDVEQSAAALKAYSLALLPFMLIKVFATGYFSRQDTKTPVKIGIIAMVLNMVANLSLIWTFQHVGLALATGFSACINALLLYRGLARLDIYVLSKETMLFVMRVAFASTVMVLAICLFDTHISSWADAVFWKRLLKLVAIITLGLTCFAGALWCAGVRPKHLSEDHKC